MYCYIQELQMKRSNSIGCGKELYVTTSNWTMNGIPYTSYGYVYSDEHFERPKKTAYKITLHDKSYRDKQGKVRKKQFHITTIKYYDFVDYSWYDCLFPNKVNEIAEEMNIDADIVWTEIENKLDALQNQIREEFEKTEEYQTKVKQDTILQEYRKKKQEFAEKYGVQEQEYDRCYDIFGVLRNEKYLRKIEQEFQTRKEYEERSSSYQRNYQSNYNYSSRNHRTSYFHSGLSSEKEKEYYKKFYRTLAAKFHPDVSGDKEAMQFLNQLKESWGI